MTSEQVARAVQMWADGKSTDDIAKEFFRAGVTEAVVCRYLDRIKARASELRAPIALQA